MNDLLQQLRDIHYPAPISFWPLAVGWYVLLALIGTLLVLSIFFVIRKYQKNRLKRIVLKRLTELQQQQNNENIAEELSMLLKRVALASFPRQAVAGLYGEEWLTFLDKTTKTNEFSHGVGRLLLNCPYQARSAPLPDSLFHLIQVWVKKNL